MVEKVIYTLIVAILIFIIYLGLRAAFMGIKAKNKLNTTNDQLKKNKK